MGWNSWRPEDAETAEQIEQTVRDMHDTAEDGPLSGTDE